MIKVTKEKTARVIPNAITICTKDEKYFFTSFGTRDKTFLILDRVWKNAVNNQVCLLGVYNSLDSLLALSLSFLLPSSSLKYCSVICPSYHPSLARAAVTNIYAYIV